MKCEKCGGSLRRIEQHWDKKNPKLLHRHAVCNDCGVEVKWTKEYQDPKMGEMIYFRTVATKSLRVVREKIKIKKEPCECRD